MTVPSERCAVASLRRGDPMTGTAAPAAGFLLLEQPGGWGRQALTGSRLDPDVGRAVSARAIALGLRALLIRRPGRHEASVRRRWAVVSARTGREMSWWGDIGSDDELLTLPLDGSAGHTRGDQFGERRRGVGLGPGDDFASFPVDHYGADPAASAGVEVDRPGAALTACFAAPRRWGF